MTEQTSTIGPPDRFDSVDREIGRRNPEIN